MRARQSAQENGNPVANPSDIRHGGVLIHSDAHPSVPRGAVLQRRATRDGIAAVVVIALLGALCAWFDPMERFLHWAHGHELLEIDELLPYMFGLTLVFAWLAYRRATDLRSEADGRERSDRAAAAVLRRTDELIRDVFEAIPDAVFVLDLDGRFVLLNRSAEALLGYSSAELRGRTYVETDLMLPVDAATAARNMEQVRGGQPTLPVELMVRRRAGGFVTLDVRAFPVSVQGVPRVLAIGRDLTERKQMDAALRDTTEWLRLAVEGSDTGLWNWDIATGAVDYSPSWRHQLGYEQGGFDGSWSAWYAILHPDDQLRVLAEFQHHIATGDAYTIEFRLRHRAGDYRWILSRAMVIRDAQGTPVRVLGAHTDITEQKASEHAVRRLSVDLARRAQQLEEANRELETFSYSVSHDLRVPLRAVKGFSRALVEDHTGELSAAGVDNLQRVVAAADRMETLIDGLLMLSRLGRRELFRRPIDVSALAAAIAVELRRHQPEREVELVVAPGLTADADPTLLRLVLENLLGNAWKYTDKRPRARIEVGATDDDGRRTYFVRDDGDGFDMRYADKLFIPFQRLHGEDEFGGTGIGLATVQRCVRCHGGEVWAQATAGGGATFFFTLGEPRPPVASPTAAAS